MYVHFTYRDAGDCREWYEAISVVEFNGTLSPTGDSVGHYICDVKDSTSSTWFKTNDDKHPVPISNSEVSKYGYIVLFKRS